jgi:hypothetical protein
MEAKNTRLFVFTLGIIFSGALLAQNVAINTTGAAPNASAILDLSNSASLAFLPPQVALTKVTVLAPVPAPGPAGLVVYSTTAPAGGGGTGLYFWDGAKWNYLSTAGASTAWNLSGNGATNPGVNYAGTSDPKDFVVKTNATERMRFLSTGSAGVGTAVPKSALDINGNMSLGTYAGVTAAPANGVIVPGQVGIGNSAPNASAILDLTNATNNLGFLMPNMTTAQRNAIGAPIKGLMVFNNTTGCINFWTGFAWENVACPTCTAPAATPGAITGLTNPVISTTGNVYSIASVPGAVSYTWSLLPLSAGTIVTSGQGTTSITITFNSSVIAYTLCVHDSNACGVSGNTCLSVNTINCVHTSGSWLYTGGVQSWTVPNCITQVTVTMAGAQGGTGGYTGTNPESSGGNGGSVSGVLSVVGGSTLNLYVGGKGTNGSSGGAGIGGYNGGANGWWWAGQTVLLLLLAVEAQDLIMLFQDGKQAAPVVQLRADTDIQVTANVWVPVPVEVAHNLWADLPVHGVVIAQQPPEHLDLAELIVLPQAMPAAVVAVVTTAVAVVFGQAVAAEVISQLD